MLASLFFAALSGLSGNFFGCLAATGENFWHILCLKFGKVILTLPIEMNVTCGKMIVMTMSKL